MADALTLSPGQPAEAPLEVTDQSIEAAVAQAEAEHQARVTGKAQPGDETPPAQEEAPTTEKAAKPDWVEDKFWDAEKGEVNTEALAKSYQELQRKQSQPPKEGEQAKTEGEQDAAAKDALSAAGFEFQALATEFETNGDFTPDTKAKLEAAFGKELVADYVTAKQAQFAAVGNSFVSEVQAAAGGAEAYTAIAAWAADTLSPAEQAIYNSDVQSGDVRRASLAASNLAARFTAEGGKAPSLLATGKTGSASDAGYASMEQMGSDLSSPRYRIDPAFRREVDAKVEASRHLLR